MRYGERSSLGGDCCKMRQCVGTDSCSSLASEDGATMRHRSQGRLMERFMDWTYHCGGSAYMPAGPSSRVVSGQVKGPKEIKKATGKNLQDHPTVRRRLTSYVTAICIPNYAKRLLIALITASWIDRKATLYTRVAIRAAFR